MRWLFLFMLAVNLSYIGWELTKANKADGEVALEQSSKNGQSIVLLSERKAADSIVQKKKIQSDRAARGEKLQPTVVSAAIKENTVSPPVIKQQETASLLGHKENEKAAKLVSVDSAPTQAGSHAENKEKHPASKQPVSVATTAVQKKSSTQQTKGAEGNTTVANTVEKPVSVAEACYSLGPFHDLKAVHKTMQAIKKYVSTASYREREKQEPPLFWVYIKPAANRKEVKKRAERLKKRKIKDYYIIRKGEQNNGISLGYFKNHNSAFHLAKRVKKDGFDVVVEPLLRNSTIYWLDYRLPATHVVPEIIENRYLSGKIRRSEQSCNKVIPNPHESNIP